MMVFFCLFVSRLDGCYCSDLEREGPSWKLACSRLKQDSHACLAKTCYKYCATISLLVIRGADVVGDGVVGGGHHRSL